MVPVFLKRYNVTYWRWDAKHVEKHWAQEIEGADIVINFAGKSVNWHYNQERMKEIIQSRTDATHTIGNAIRQTVAPHKLWINAASATIYHNAMDGPQDEFTGRISERKNDNMPYSTIDRLRRAVKKQFVAWRSIEWCDDALREIVDNTPRSAYHLFKPLHCKTC